jgi:hypothetical protein
MQHKTQEELQRVAVVHPDQNRLALTRDERLERWAELLMQEPNRQLSTLHGTEYHPAESRGAMRSLGSPISVAFEDPALRAEGLVDDTYGEARRFFELTDWQLHDIVCYCHHSASMTAESAARRVRAAIGAPGPRNVFTRALNAIVG